MASVASPVKTFAVERGIVVFQPEQLRAADVVARLRAARAEVLIVAAYGLLLPPSVLEIMRYGAINLHASLLPRWRGAAPIQRALLAGDTETGVSIMQMDAGVDTGPVFAQRALAIEDDDDSGSLHDKLAGRGAEALLEVLADLEAGRARAQPQSTTGVTYARKIEKSETRLLWERPAGEIERTVRAFRPSPGANTKIGADAVKIWRTRVVAGEGQPGTVLENEGTLHVACGVGAVSIEELQPAGGRKMRAADFLRGRRLLKGARLE
jgi:methionyl-tRNA formyltransferase